MTIRTIPIVTKTASFATRRPTNDAEDNHAARLSRHSETNMGGPPLDDYAKVRGHRR